MQSANIMRGFHRIGMLIAAPLGLGAIAALVCALGLYVSPGTVGPLFGYGPETEIEIVNGPTVKLRDVVEKERLGTLDASQQGLLAEARKQGLIPEGGFTTPEAISGALNALGLSGFLLILAAVWYGLMRSLGWVITGFMA